LWTVGSCGRSACGFRVDFNPRRRREKSWGASAISSEVQAEILALFYSDKRSIRRIARGLGINRATVRRIVERKLVQIDRPERCVCASILDPYNAEVDRVLAIEELYTGSAVLNRLRSLGYTGAITVLRDYLRQNGRAHIEGRGAAQVNELVL